MMFMAVSTILSKRCVTSTSYVWKIGHKFGNISAEILYPRFMLLYLVRISSYKVQIIASEVLYTIQKHVKPLTEEL